MTRDRFLDNRSLILMLHREHSVPYAEIAKDLNLSARSVWGFLRRQGMTPIMNNKGRGPAESNGNETHKRRCLSCRKPFAPESRGLFMCKICRRKDHEGLVW